MRNQSLTKYKKLNNSFKKHVVFKIGDDAGFFSEYNNMILSMAYCLRNKIQFKLFSGDANFGYDKGWADYFLPFCKEIKSDFHSKFNFRHCKEGNFRPAYRKILFRLKIIKQVGTDYPLYFQLKRKFGLAPLLTQDIFEHARVQKSNENFQIEALEFNGNLKELCKQLTELTWCFNERTKDEIQKLIKTLNLPKEYLSFHIRGGDKIKEYKLILPTTYIEHAKIFSDIKNAFVLTDDYRIIEELKSKYPAWTFYTLCKNNERGFYLNEFRKLDNKTKKAQHLRLFASMQLLEHANHFVGTLSSNPGMFLGMKMETEKCHGVDFSEWKIW